MWTDLRPLLYVVLLFVAATRAGPTGHTGEGIGHTGSSGLETGGSADGDGCEDLSEQVCVPWAREVQGECPAMVPCQWGCQPHRVGAPVYADGRCCWAVDEWSFVNCGCGC